MIKPKHIHFVGIKGVGMTPLAIIAKEAKIKVTGCDINEEFITDPVLKKNRIEPIVGFSKDHIKNIDLVITTGAHGGFDNPEVKAAKELNTAVWTQGQAVGEFMRGEILGRMYKGISVTGCHGKTTTTAMAATILEKAGLDPSYVIGTSEIPSLKSSGHFGKGQYFVAEADEYATEPLYDKTPKFMWQNPKFIVITNIEHDHPDLYPTIENFTEALSQFVKKLQQNGVLITYGDDSNVQKLLKRYANESAAVTYGFSIKNKIFIQRIHYSDTQTFFNLSANGHSLGEFVIKVTGEHNVLNATAAVTLAIELGVSIDAIKKGISFYRGSKRRLEYIGKNTSGSLIYDDYAHHPTEIKKTLRALRRLYPKEKIVCIFEPHTYSRTKILFDQFIHSFSDSDAVILGKIYPSLRESSDPSVSSKRMAQEMQNIHKEVVFLPTYADMIEYVKQKGYGEQTVIIMMGAGSIYTLSQKLLKL